VLSTVGAPSYSSWSTSWHRAESESTSTDVSVADHKSSLWRKMSAYSTVCGPRDSCTSESFRRCFFCDFLAAEAVTVVCVGPLNQRQSSLTTTVIRHGQARARFRPRHCFRSFVPTTGSLPEFPERWFCTVTCCARSDLERLSGRMRSLSHTKH
jgi:hypothetical protein